MYQSPRRAFLVNTWSIIYLLLNGRTELRRKFCVVFFNVLAEVEILIPQLSLRSWAVTYKFLSELWNVWVIVMSDLPGSMLGLPNSSLFSEELFLFIRSMLNTMSSMISSFLISPPVLSMVIMCLNVPISSSKVLCDLGKTTLCGSHAWGDYSTMCGHWCISWSDGVNVLAYTIVPAIASLMQNSLSSVMIEGADSDIEFSCTFIP